MAENRAHPASLRSGRNTAELDRGVRLILYFALLGDLVQLGAESGNEPLEYFAGLSFFAGFSERWVRGVLSPVAQLAGGDEPQQQPEQTAR